MPAMWTYDSYIHKRSQERGLEEGRCGAHFTISAIYGPPGTCRQEEAEPETHQCSKCPTVALITGSEIGCINYSACKRFQTVCCMQTGREGALLPPVAITSITPLQCHCCRGLRDFTVFHPWKMWSRQNSCWTNLKISYFNCGFCCIFLCASHVPRSLLSSGVLNRKCILIITHNVQCALLADGNLVQIDTFCEMSVMTFVQERNISRGRRPGIWVKHQSQTGRLCSVNMSTATLSTVAT